ncbi:MAG: hypothetical protein BA864_00310 [Desulfuromonadales bacterium C00003093]|nr:MAG: hypothetical protein BA864_00310 [Desulfuromonadales bacterium C00003093]
MRAQIIVLLSLLMLVGSAAAIEADTNIRLDPHPDHISFYTNSTYITCNYTIQEPANVTIIFEKYNTTDNSSDTVTDFGEFAVNQTAQFNIATTNFSTVGWYRAAMYDIDGDILCYYEVAVRSHTSANYEALHGSIRFDDADSVPSVSFVEKIAGRAQTWTTDSISLTHSIVLWGYNESWSMASGGNYTYIDHTNTSANVTNWVLAQTYDVNQYYRMILYSHDGEVLDTHCVKAVIPTANIVEVRAMDSQKGIPIPVFTVNMNGHTQNVTNGVAYFTNVTNGAHIITVTAETYLDAQKTVYMANSYINTTVYMLAYYPFAPAHHDVEFIVTSIFNKRYDDVAVTADYQTANGENATMSGVTDSTGSISFSMVSTTLYTMSFINDTQGVNKTITVHPKDDRYTIIIGLTGKWTEYEDRPMDSIHITVKKSIINDTHAYINVTYRDDTNGTLQLVAWINQTNAHDPRNPTGIASHTFSGDLNNTNHSFIVSNYKGQSYQVRIWHEHDQFGTFYDRSVRFAGMLIDLGLPTAFYFWFAIATLFFVAAFFGATTTSVGSIVVCALGWVFLAIGWLAALGIFGPISLTLASVYAVANNLITRHHRGGFA